jgi:hypothetical protein
MRLMKRDNGIVTAVRLVLLLSTFCASHARVTAASVIWGRTNDTLTCKMAGQVLWTFSYATNQGKPYFHPLAVLGSEPLTTFKPKDHIWHYGLWFSWKYINGINYWEEDKVTGKAQGATRWSTPDIKANPDGSALINLKLDYVSPTNGTMMTELRRLTVSAPDQDGNVLLDWVATFQAGPQPLLLDRTHMPGEENGAVNGGYAGLSLRAAQAPANVEFLTMDKMIEKYESDRARPNSPAAACNVTRGNRKDGVAILSLTENTHRPAPWYMINSQAMRWFSPALLAPAPKHVAPREIFTWKFRIITKAGGWTTEDLAKAAKNYDPQVASTLEQRREKETEK